MKEESGAAARACMERAAHRMGSFSGFCRIVAEDLRRRLEGYLFDQILWRSFPAVAEGADNARLPGPVVFHVPPLLVMLAFFDLAQGHPSLLGSRS